MKYRVNEIFKSLQGEGFNQGKEVIFLRLAGCNLACSWCDTDYHPYTEYSVEMILNELATYDCKSVLLTGGEPSVQILDELLHALKNQNYWIAIETNGTINLDRYNGLIDYISLSPKKQINQFVASEVRVVNDALTIDKLLSIEKTVEADNYYLSPLEIGGEMNIRETMQLLAGINASGTKPWRMSLQLHKLIGIR